MPAEYPYMRSQKNLPDILKKIKVAQTPPRFTHEFLKSNLGFGSSSDRPMIQVLKQLGFLSSDSTPTARYNQFRADPEKRSPAMAEGLREGWSEVFMSDQNAHQRSSTELKEIIKNVTGKSESVAEKMAATFKTLGGYADFSAQLAPREPKGDAEAAEEKVKTAAQQPGAARMSGVGGGVSLHNDVHIHLPATSDTAVYTAIFRALREELLD